MNGTSALRVYSEIGKLKTMVVHQPSVELDNLAPDYMGRLLFDDIPDSLIAAEEHKKFQDIIRSCGAEVIQVEDLFVESLLTPEIQKEFLVQYLKESYEDPALQEAMLAHLIDKTPKELVHDLIRGIRKEELSGALADKMKSYEGEAYPLCLDPLVNLYFSRDAFATIGQGVSINKMQTQARARESLMGEYIFKYHPKYKTDRIYYQRTYPHHLEGGDILVLSPKVLAVGISQRTNTAAVEALATSVFKAEPSYEHILGFQIPSTRAFMHLDTVFTQIDRDLFVVHPGIEEHLKVFDWARSEVVDQDAEVWEYKKIEEYSDSLEHILEKFLEIEPMRIVRCGGSSPIDAQREQWSDGSNVVALAPNEIIVYNRNRVTNEILADLGVNLHVIPSSEISRGRGGPRCMSMPLWREDVE